MITAVFDVISIFLSLGMSGIRIQRHIAGNVFIQRLQIFFVLVTFFFTC